MLIVLTGVILNQSKFSY